MENQGSCSVSSLQMIQGILVLLSFSRSLASLGYNCQSLSPQLLLSHSASGLLCIWLYRISQNNLPRLRSSIESQMQRLFAMHSNIPIDSRHWHSVLTLAVYFFNMNLAGYVTVNGFCSLGRPGSGCQQVSLVSLLCKVVPWILQ